MQKIIFLWLAVAALLCSCDQKKSKVTDAVPQQFERKWRVYQAFTREWSELDCDWLLFESLRDAVLKKTDLVPLAMTDAGHWFRTPAHDCRPTGRSASDISRDMLLGLALFFWQIGDAQSAHDVVVYAQGHQGVMGGGDPLSTDIRPGLLSTFMAIEKRVGDGAFPLPPKVEDPDPEAQTSVALTSNEIIDLLVQTGYRAHLTVLHIFLRGLVWGGISDLETRILKSQVDRQPHNALYLAVYHKFTDGDQSATIALLMDETLFPHDRLPTTDFFCTDYLWQRDEESSDWQPCPGGTVHPGIDWLLAAAIVRNGFRETH